MYFLNFCPDIHSMWYISWLKNITYESGERHWIVAEVKQPDESLSNKDIFLC